MKKLLLACVLMITFINGFAQNEYSNGFLAGYKEGYCYNDFGCISPIPPLTPLPLLGESSYSYQDGYNRGFKRGLEDKAIKKTNSSNSGTGTTNRNAQPAQSNYINTYVSPDWDLLIRAAQAKQENERQIALSKMKQTVNQYLSFSNYPDKIQNGWHNIVVMDNYNFCDERKVLVENNQITKYVIDNFSDRPVTFSGNIDKGRGIIKIRYPNNEESGYLDVFFIESISNPRSYTSAPQESGRISFWTDWKRASTMVLYMEGDYVSPFTSYFENVTPACGQKGTVTITYKPGTYNYRVEGQGAFGTVYWEGRVTISPGICKLQKLTKK